MPRDINVRSRYRSEGDIQQRHSDTYVGVKCLDTGEITTHYCNSVGGSYPDASSLNLTSRGGDERRLRLTSEELVIDRPELGLANVRSGRYRSVLMVYGLASRQYKRSLYWGCLDYQDVVPDLDINITSRERNYIIDQFYNDAYPTYHAALSQLKGNQGTKAVAFSRRFCVVKSPSGLVLYYESSPVGYVDNEDNTILFTHYQHLVEQLEEDK